MSNATKYRAFYDGEFYLSDDQGEEFMFELNPDGWSLSIMDHYFESGSGAAEEYYRYIEAKGAIFDQFTGRSDTEGNELFAHDIIAFTFWWFDGNECVTLLTGEIVYSEEHMSYQLKGVKNKEWQAHTGEDGSDYLTPFSELNFEDADFHRIGNSHQNPELLEVVL